MKIRSQDAKKLLDLCECYVADCSTGEAGVYVKSRYGKDAALVGVYESEARAKGVMYEICLADCRKERVFYMPGA